MNEFQGYRPCRSHNNTTTRGRFVKKCAGLSMLICYTCHQPYYMDENGNEISISAMIKRLIRKERN